MSEAARDGKMILYELDGKVVADVRSAEELAERITLFPGYAVVQKVQLSEQSRGGIIMPNPDTKDQQHLMLWKVAVVGPQKHAGEGNPREMRAKVGEIVVLKPSVSQFLVNQRHQFGVISDLDIVGTVKFDEAPAQE
jgi:co-chaperonin GroES (HSP10)